MANLVGTSFWIANFWRFLFSLHVVSEWKKEQWNLSIDIHHLPQHQWKKFKEVLLMVDDKLDVYYYLTEFKIKWPFPGKTLNAL